MKFTVAAALFAAAGVSAQHNGTVIVTETVSSYTTYCPSPTEITHGTQTYTVTEATTLTITDCPCTITRPIITATSEAPVPTLSVPPVESHPVPSPPHGGYNSTIVVPPPAPTGSIPSPPAGTPPPADLPAAAGKTVLSVGLLAGVVGLAAFL